MAEQKPRIDTTHLEKVEKQLQGKAVGIIPKVKLFRVKLKIETIVHRFIVHENPVEAGRRAAAAEGLGVFGEGSLSSVTPIEVKDVTGSAVFNALIGEEGENS